MGYKYDMHTHSSGSYDSNLDIFDTIEKLRDEGYAGMVITDHDSFAGFNDYFDAGYGYEDFAVIKGMEITTDQGHLLVIPPNIDDTYLENEVGISLDDAIQEARKRGYLIGLPHPYCPYYGVLNENSMHSNRDNEIIESVDFIECYNYGVSSHRNDLARNTAEAYGKFMTAGSDSHVIECVGNAYTEFNEFLEDNESFVDNFSTSIIRYGKSFDYTD